MSANVVIIRPQKISVAPLTALNLRSIVVFAASIPHTEKRGSITVGKPAIFVERRHNRPVARTVRAPDSKSGGWGFKSLLACLLLRGATYSKVVSPSEISHDRFSIVARDV